MSHILTQLKTLVADDVLCPRCSKTIARTHKDPRGVELPHCCNFFWVPSWKIVNRSLQFHLTFYRPEGMPYEANIIHKNEIKEDQTTDTDAPERQSSVESSDTDLPMNPVEPSANPVQSSVNPVQSSVDPVQSSPNTSGSRAPRFPELPRNLPVYLHPDLEVKEQVCEYLQDVNGEHTANTGEIRAALGLAKSTFKWATDKLIEEGRVEQIGYGLWKLIRC